MRAVRVLIKSRLYPWRTMAILALAMGSLVFAACGTETTPGATLVTPEPSGPGSSTQIHTGVVDAPIEKVDIELRGVDSSDALLVVVSGLRDGCETFGDYELTRDGDELRLRVTNLRQSGPDLACTEIYRTVTTRIPVDGETKVCQVFDVVVNRSLFKVQALAPNVRCSLPATPTPEATETPAALPPLPVISVTHGDTIYEGVEGSYCWPDAREAETVISLCADKIFPTSGFPSTLPVVAGDSVTVETKADSAPRDLWVSIWKDPAGSSVMSLNLDANSPTVTVDLPAGIYIISVFGRWEDGDISYQFQLEVRPSVRVDPTEEPTALPPLPVMRLLHSQTSYDGEEGIYCWPDGSVPADVSLCRDIFPPATISARVPLAAGDIVTVDIEADGPPKDLSISISKEFPGPSVMFLELAPSAPSFPVDLPAGTYIMSIFGRWEEGDITYHFQLEVAEAEKSSDIPTREPASSIPKWLADLITEQESEQVANPPASLTRYEFRGQTVYFLPQRCCDIMSVLYDAQGGIMGHPDGGITGEGDSRVADFFDERASGQTVWQDHREPSPGSETVQVTAGILRTELLILESFPIQYRLLVVSSLPNGCVSFGGYTLARDGYNFRVTVFNYLPTDRNVACTADFRTVETSIALSSDLEPSQSYTVLVNEETISFSAH